MSDVVLPPQASEPELVSAVRKLTSVVEQLTALVDTRLSREEASLLYTTKEQSKARRTQAVVLVLVAVLIALFVSAGAMFGAMNYCFFTGSNGQHGFTREGACNIIPGYDATQQQIAQSRVSAAEATAALAQTAQQNSIINAKQDAQLAAIEQTLQRIEQKLGIPQ